MSETVASCETSRSTLRLFGRAAADRGAITGRPARTPGLAPHHKSSTHLELRSASELEVLEVSNDRADHHATARLLVIGDDPALIPDQLRRAFPAPAHLVHVAGSGHAGLERVRTDSHDVIVLD